MINKHIHNFFKTFFITIAIIIFILLSIHIFFSFKYLHGENEKSDEYLYDKELWAEMISEFKKEEQSDPLNYEINMNIAILYEMENNLELAKKEYEKVIIKTENLYYTPIFLLADLYLQEYNFIKACQLVDAIKTMPIDSLLKQKSSFYRKYGDILFQQKKYNQALSAYSKAIYFMKKIKGAKLNYLNDRLLNTYIALSDLYATKGDYNKAIYYINEAKEYREDAIIDYKQALLYMNKDLNIAAKFFKKTQLKNPQIINYQLYKNTLTELKNAAQKEKNKDLESIYDIKLKNLDRFIQTNFVLDRDFEIIYNKAALQRIFFTKYLTFEYTIKNNRFIPVNKLYLLIEVKDANNNIIYENKDIIATPQNKFHEAETKTYKTTIKLKHSMKQPFITSIYLTKNKKMPLKKISERKIFLK